MNILNRKNDPDDASDHRGVGEKLNRFLRRNAEGDELHSSGMLREKRRAEARRRRLLSLRKKHAAADPADTDPQAGPGRETGPEAGAGAGVKGLFRRGGRTRKGRKRTVKERRETRVSWIFLSPSVAGVAVFFVLPFLVVIYYSVIDNPIRHNFVGLSNYMKVLGNTAFRMAAMNTLRFSLLAVPLAVGLSLLLAVVMEQRLPWKSRFRTFFLSPMMVPTASVIMIWQILFHYNGLVNVFLRNFGGARIDWLKSGYAQIPIVLLFLWKNLGYNMILFMSGLANIPRDQIEVARLESATEFQIFWLIKIRYLSSTILFVTIMSLINSFKVFREIYLMTGDYPYDALYMMQHFMNNTFRSLDYQKLSAAAVLMAVFMIIVIGALFLTEDWFGRDLE